jgi:hypothetical protein
VHEIAKLVLLQELLGQVLEVTLAEMDVSNDGDFAAVAFDFNSLAKLTGFTVDLEFVVHKVFLQEFKEKRIVEEKEEEEGKGIKVGHFMSDNIK